MVNPVFTCFDGFCIGVVGQDRPVLVRDTDDDLDGASQEGQRFSELYLDISFIAAVFNPILFLSYVQNEDVERGVGRVVVRLLHELLDGILEPSDGFLLNHDQPIVLFILFFCY